MIPSADHTILHGWLSINKFSMSTPQVLPNDLSFYAGSLSDSTLVAKPSVVSAGLENEVSPCAARSGLAPTVCPRPRLTPDFIIRGLLRLFSEIPVHHTFPQV